MKIEQTRAPRPSPQSSATTAASAVSTYGKTAAASAAPADVASVMGVPEAELTPKVRAALMDLMAEVGQLRDELQKSHARVNYLEKLADEDSLVDALNRRAFVRELSRMMSYAQRYGSPSSVLYFDIDGMKMINDGHGHAAGDAALSWVADILTRHVRESDVVGRLGGDEFGIILAQADEATANEKADVLVAAIDANPFVWNGIPIHLGLSVGAFTFHGGDDAGRILHEADRAMYARKTLRTPGT